MTDGSRHEAVGERDLERVYLAQAAERVEEMTPEGGPLREGDVAALQNRIYRALGDDAVHELREVVSQLRGGLEMATLSNDGGADEVVLDRDRVETFMEALDRTEALLETYLDPSTVHMLLVRVDPEPFDLARHLQHFLTTHGMDPEADGVRADLESVTVEADRAKVIQGLGHVAMHLHQRWGTGGDLVVTVGPGADGKGARGQIALEPAPYDSESLIQELDRPFRLSTMEIDIPYVRAIMERHGGSLHVQEAEDGALGYGFRLPPTPPEVPR